MAHPSVTLVGLFILVIGSTVAGQSQHYSEAWWWQHHAVGMFFSSRLEGKMNAENYRDILDGNQRSPSNLMELERRCEEEWAKRNGQNCPKLDSERTPRAAPSSACQEHASLHNRLDVVEKKVEDTVGKLEAELAALLEDIEDPKWRPLLDKTGNPVDILDDPASVQS
ncbi:uncharacterized protein LOC133559281 isoform X1 [Nerophis ophidion]|uniref:uncharacterized protein LOC133559281 isoform X1 n=1 Tax=Nerophis ophidion TaxID=159077 RepID=UPI002ADFFEF9|nr:uncharacterized protein LOC133559281 isoform X1 [Nerophis ophidion]